MNPVTSTGSACETCGWTVAADGTPESETEACDRCDRRVRPRPAWSAASLSGVQAKADATIPMGRPGRSGLIPARGPGKFASELRRIAVPGMDEPPSAPSPLGRPVTERNLHLLDSTQEMTESVQAQLAAGLDATANSPGIPPPIPPAPNVTRQRVVRALSALEQQISVDWIDLLTADRFPALLARLERARRLSADARLDEAIRLVTAFQGKILGQLLDDFAARLRVDDLERADTLLQQARAIADDHPRLAMATAELARGHDDRRASREGQLKLERARELSAPPHEPRNLKQALKLYDDLLRRIERYPALRPAFDVIRDERDEVERHIKEADSRESERRTAIAIGQIDDLVATLDDYRESLGTGTLNPHYARGQMDQVARLIGERLAPKMQEFLQDSEVLAANPRDAEVALDRLREYKRLWQYLPSELRATVERREEQLVGLIQRRDEVLAEVDQAIGQVHRGDYVAAICQLSVQAQLHAEFQIDVERPISIAAGALAQQIRHQLDGVDLLLTDPHTDDAEVSRLGETLRAILERVEPVAGIVPDLGALRERAAGMRQTRRQLKAQLERFDRQFDRCRDAIDAGRIAPARRLVERMATDVPLQRRAHLTDLKVELDIAIEEDEIEARLQRLALTDPEAATEWAEAHADRPACRRFLLESTANDCLRDASQLEQAGRVDDALRVALAVQAESPAGRAEELERLVDRLRHIARDAAEVERRLQRAEALQAQDRWAESLTLLAEDVEPSAHRLADWRAARHRAEAALDRAHIEEITARLDGVRDAREAWQARPLLPDDCLAPQPADGPPAAEAAARLDEALRLLERIPMDDALRTRWARDDSPAAARLALQRLVLEEQLCAAEHAIARADFTAARTRLADAESHPAVQRVQARLARFEFGRQFGQVLAAGERARAEAMLAAYPAPSADEAVMARRLIEVHARAEAALDAAVDTTAGADASPTPSVEGIRRARLEVVRFVEGHPYCSAALDDARRRLDEGLVAAVERTFGDWALDLVPGGVIAQVDLVASILGEGPPIAALEEQCARLQERLPGEGREFLEWVETHTRLDALSPRQVADIETRLTALGRFVDPDPQFDRCQRRIRQLRTDIGRQIDARRRHDALLGQALETLDGAALDEACRLEQTNLITGDRAVRLRASWAQAEPVVAELKRAIADRAFDRAERLLDRLHETGSVAHMARLDLPHPFEAGSRLPQGIDGVRGVLPRLRSQAEQVVAARAQEVEALERAVDTLHRALRRAVADAPPCPTAEHEEAFIRAISAQAFDRLGQITQQIEAAGRDSAAGTGSSLRALAARLPPRNPTELMAHVTALHTQYRADHAAVVALSHAELSAVRGNRAGLMAVKRRWDGAEDLVGLVDALLRLVG